jgi:lambda family phage portal protein
VPERRAVVATRGAMAHPGFDFDLASGTLRVRQPQMPPGRLHGGADAARMYSAARTTRNTTGFGTSTTSADTELASSLTLLRNRARQMVRDSAYARRARDLVVNNVIGPGMDVQAQVMGVRGEPRHGINDSIEAAWREWCAADSCHTGGALHFGDLERAAMAQVFEAGECFVRAHDVAFGDSAVPLALELIEAERLADGIADPGAVAPGAELRMGVEVDRRFGRPLAYWVRRRHPGDVRHGNDDSVERVPASQMYHLRIVTRWPQTRGEPWLHAVVRKLDDMAECTQLELTAARGSAAYFATITSPEAQDEDEVEEDGTGVMALDPLTIRKLDPGEELQFHAPNRPNTQLDPFLRMMLREVATGVNVSYASLSGDYSQTNYSSSRLALLDDRDVWRALQQWWIRAFRLPLHKRWVRQATLAGAVNVPVAEYAGDMGKFEAVRFKPRGWTWVDPAKEVAAYKEGVMGGMTTLTDVIAATGEGRDIEDFIATRKRELAMLREAGILTDTEVKPEPKPAAPAAAARPAPDNDGEDDDPPAAARTAHRPARMPA